VTGLPSIRRRLSQAVAQVALAWGVGASLVVGWAAHHEIDELLDSTLQESAEILFGVLGYNAASLPLGSAGAMPAPPHDEKLVWQLVGAKGTVLLRSHEAPAQAMLAAAQPGLADAPGGWRLYAMRFPAGGEGTMLLVAQTEAERSEATLEASLSTAGAALLVGLLCTFWLRQRVNIELRPLRALARAVKNFHPTDAGATLAPATRVELLPIREAILDLGGRLTLRVDSERAITAHAAHALRTPLAGLAAQLAVAMREAPPELQPRIQKARQASLRLQRVVTALLTLFRSGVEPHWQRIDMATLVHSLPMEGLPVHVLSGSEPFWMDPDLLAAALLNLLDNALRYGASRVDILTERRGSEAVLRIRDDGPGVTPERRTQMQEAMATQRYEQAMGLGLMLTDLVVRAHRGRLELPALEQGFGLDITLPQTIDGADRPA
jgi:two-component system OmpR family sensor kinase